MSDVPVTAAWLAALLLARRPSPTGSALAGLAAARDHDPAESRTAGALRRPSVRDCVAQGSRGRMRHMVVCASACCLAHRARIHPERAIRITARFGLRVVPRPLRFSNIGPNLSRYPRWLTMAHSPFLWLWLLAPLWFIARVPGRGVRLDRLRVRRGGDRGLPAVCLFPPRRMVLHALPAAGPPVHAALRCRRDPDRGAPLAAVNAARRRGRGDSWIAAWSLYARRR